MQKLREIPNPGPKTMHEFVALNRAETHSQQAMLNAWNYLQRCIHYANDTYHVAVDQRAEHGFGPSTDVWHLSIKRHDREPIHDWRDLQEIKNQVCGEHIEAMELYPAESRVVDTANQYHLWALVPPTGAPGDAPRVPFGFTEGCKVDDPNFGNAKQRPRK